VAAERVRAPAAAVAAVALAVGVGLAGCGAAATTRTSASAGAGGGGDVPPALVREARPIGRGRRFHPPARGPVVGACRRGLGRRAGVHVEVFGADRVVLLAAGIGVRPPVRLDAGRIVAARCFGALVTVDPTGVVLVRSGARLTLADLFRSWGEPLGPRRLASFTGRVRVYLDGRPLAADPRQVRLAEHAEIVLEVGPYVPPHAAYRFPPGA
jgi:hypothetical protein